MTRVDITAVQDSLQQRITSTFDPDQAESVSARLSATLQAGRFRRAVAGRAAVRRRGQQARAALAASAAESGVDTAAVTAGIDEARKALREMSRVEARAKAIAQGADEIKGLVSFQVRRTRNALDEATAGLADQPACAAS